MSRSSPSTFAAIRILRTNGELGELRSVSMEAWRSMTGVEPRRRLATRAVGGDRRARSSTGDDQVDGLRTLALLVGLDVEGDALPLGQRLEPGSLDGGDVHEDVATSVVRLDEAVAALGIEEFDRTCHGHRETPLPVVAPPPTPTARRLGRTFTNGESSGLTAYVTPPGPHRRRNVKASAHKNRLIQGCGKVAKLLFAGEPIDGVAAARSRQGNRKFRQQDCQFAGERPWRIDHDQAARAEPRRRARRGNAQFSAQNL